MAEKFTKHDTGGKKPDSARDMGRGDWRGMIRGLLKFLIEESNEPEHAEDDRGYNDEVKRRGAGVLLIEPMGRVLFVKRGIGSDHPGTWCFPGGLVEEDDESDAAAAVRELYEEVGEFGDCSADQLKALDRRVHNGTDFSTFVQPVDSTFIPRLSDEHDDYSWSQLEDYPEPIHPGVKATLDALSEGDGGEAEDSDKTDDIPEPVEQRPTITGNEPRPDLLREFLARRKEAQATDAETKHDPANGQFATGGGEQANSNGGGQAKFSDTTLKLAKGKSLRHAQSMLFNGMQNSKYAKMETLPAANIETFQKTLNPSRVQEYSENPGRDPDVVKGRPSGELFAFRRDGHVVVVDGNHRVAAKAAKGESIDIKVVDMDRLIKDAHAIQARDPSMGETLAAMKAAGVATDAIQLHNREVPKDYSWAMGGKVGTGKSTTEMSREVKRDIAAIHAKDAMPLMAYDRASVEHVGGVRYHLEFDPTIVLAYDRDTVRDKDTDGRLHISQSHISKATVNPYRGKEIPNFEAMGLDADTKYMLLRDPEELQKGAATFNNLPILSQHVPLTAKTHDPDLVIGSTGTDSSYEHPYLDNSLVFWPQAAIDAIEDDEVRQLSCCYHYDPDMTPGEYEGQHYDGVMRNIRGNHVALVPEGRAGADVMVMDAMPKQFAMDALARGKDGRFANDYGPGQNPASHQSGGGSFKHAAGRPSNSQMGRKGAGVGSMTEHHAALTEHGYKPDMAASSRYQGYSHPDRPDHRIQLSRAPSYGWSHMEKGASLGNSTKAGGEHAASLREHLGEVKSAHGFAKDAPPSFEEGKHKRDHGKFTSGGGGGGGAAPQRGTNQGYHQLLTRHGYQQTSAGTPATATHGGTNPVYKHPDGHEVVHSPSGGYTHYYGKGGQRGTSYKEGSSHGHLAQTLERAKSKSHIRGTKDAALAGDSKEKNPMTAVRLSPGARLAKGALIAYLMPRLAADANIAVSPLFTGINGKNMMSKRALLVNRVQTAVRGKLAQDADVDDIAEMLESVEELCRGEESGIDDMDGNANSAVPMYRDRDNDGARDNVPGLSDEAQQFLHSKLSPEDYEMLCQMHEKPAGEDEDDDEEGEVHHVGAESGEEEPDVVVVNKDRRIARDEPPDFEGKPKLVTRQAMDAAIQAAARSTEKRVRDQMRSISDAHSEVRPYVGDIGTVAFDSAEGVYRHALKMLAVDGAETIHESALKTILGMQRRAAKKPSSGSQPLAADVAAGGAAAQGSFGDRFAATRNIGRM